MKVLVVGGGGREHALAWKIAQSPRVRGLYVAPGNAGTARDPRFRNVALSEPDALAELARSETIDLTVVGPEAPLSAGIVDLFRERGLRIFGPTRAAAQLEASKDFAKAFMQRHAIATAPARTFTDAAAARDYVRSRGAPIVIKADGLAAGKGVVVAQTPAQALDAIEQMLVHGRLGKPEEQPSGMRLRSDLVDWLDHAVDARLERIEADWDRRVALGVVVAAQGYPEAPRRGDPIASLPADAEDCIVFHAGTRMQ